MAEETSEHKTEDNLQATGQTKTASKSGGNVLTHKLGPLPVWGWFAVGLVTYLLYKHFKGSSSSTTTVPIGTVTSGTGALIGGDGTTGTTSTTATTTTGADWISQAYQALQNLGYDNNTINDALQKYASGQPLNPTEYGIVEAAIKLIGAAPSALGNPTEATNGGPSGGGSGGGKVNNPTSAPPNLPAALIAAMQGNGEHLVDTVYDPTTSEWLYLTNKGGVYALNGQGGTSGTSFFGSLFSLPSNVFAGRTAQKLVVNPNGGYTVIDTAGEGYTFGPSGTGTDYANGATPS